MTLCNAYSWSPVGKRLYVAYEAPQGRRVNAVGALFHKAGGQQRRFAFATLARAPSPNVRQYRRWPWAWSRAS